MNDIILKGRVKNAAKTDAEWLTINPTLKLGEKVWVITSTEPFMVCFKVGDGRKNYTELPFQFINPSYTLHSMNFGLNNQAGGKGYKVIGMAKITFSDVIINNDFSTSDAQIEEVPKQNNSDAGNDKLLLIPEDKSFYYAYKIQLQENEIIEYSFINEEDTIYSIYLKSNKEQAGKILGIKDNYLIVDTLFYPYDWDRLDKTNQEEQYNKSYLFCENQSTVGNIIIGYCNFVSGESVKAIAPWSSAQNYGTKAIGKYGNAEGCETIAGYAAHSQNLRTKAPGQGSHAQNKETEALGAYSHAGGEKSKSYHRGSFTHGLDLISGKDYQTLFGQYNEIDSEALLILGNGTGNSARKNALTIYPNGKIYDNTIVYKLAPDESSYVVSATQDYIYAELEIANYYKNKPVIQIQSNAFKNNENIKKVIFGNNIKTTSSTCFYNCINLEEVVLNEGLENLGDSNFNGCTKLNKVIFPSTITSLGGQIFKGGPQGAIYDFTKCTQIPTLASNTNRHFPENSTILVNEKIFNDWIQTDIWNEYYVGTKTNRNAVTFVCTQTTEEKIEKIQIELDRVLEEIDGIEDALVMINEGGVK